MLSGFTTECVYCETMAHIRAFVYVRERKICINLCADQRGLVYLDYGIQTDTRPITA